MDVGACDIQWNAYPAPPSHTPSKPKHQTVCAVACSGRLRRVSMWDITELINVTPPIKSGQMDALVPKGGVGQPVYNSLN